MCVFSSGQNILHVYVSRNNKKKSCCLFIRIFSLSRGHLQLAFLCAAESLTVSQPTMCQPCMVRNYSHLLASHKTELGFFCIVPHVVWGDFQKEEGSMKPHLPDSCSASILMNIWFWFFGLTIGWITLIALPMLNHPWIPRISCTWSWCGFIVLFCCFVSLIF